jgi:GNAT superfamily N-acetyltransferase
VSTRGAEVAPSRPVDGADLAAAGIVAATYAEWYRVLGRVPGVELHDDDDLVWVIHPGSSYGNGGTHPRFGSQGVGRRLDQILARYRAAGRGFGLWVDPGAQPEDLERHLRARKLRCRKYFPAMLADLDRAPEVPRVPKVTFDVLDDHAIFSGAAEHPYYGRITTPMRQFELDRLAALSRLRPRRVWDIVAWLDGRPVGACTLFRGSRAFGVFDVGVVNDARRRGIGAALMAHALSFAREAGGKAAILISSGMGHGMYQRVGFRDVCKVGYWYRAP